MRRDALLAQFDGLNVWKRGSERAPHKPLLVLYALGKWSRGEDRLISFQEVDEDLAELLREFGQPARTTIPSTPSGGSRTMACGT